MRPTVKPTLRRDKSRADGTCPIYIRITANRKSCYINTKIRVLPSNWNERKRVVRSADPLSVSKNNTIARLSTATNLAAEHHRTVDAVKAEVMKGYSGVFQFLDEYIEDLGLRGQYWEQKKFAVTRRKMLEVFSPSVNWIQFDSRQLVKFESHLRHVLGNSNNTIHNEMKRLRRLFRKAHAKRLVSADDNPFLLYSMPKKTTPSRRRMGYDEIQKLLEVELEEGSKLRIARDVFAFSYFAGGIRFSDVCVLRPENFKDGRLVFSSMKTGQRVSNKLPEPVVDLVQTYCSRNGRMLFPLIDHHVVADPIGLRRQISSKNVMVNSRLKQVAALAGVEPKGLTMHVARHSVANEAQSQGHEIRAIQSMLGHSKVTTTQTYLDELNLERNDRLMGSLWATGS